MENKQLQRLNALGLLERLSDFVGAVAPLSNLQNVLQAIEDHL